jgi:hypothetical protein
MEHHDYPILEFDSTGGAVIAAKKRDAWPWR